MKKIQFIFLVYFLCLAGLFVSCIRDNSMYDTQVISRIEFQDSLKKNFSVDKLDTLIIEAPSFTQAHIEKEVQYEWEIEYKKAGKGKVLKYVCPKLGTFPGRLKISNEDGAVFYKFTLTVKSPYHQGLMVLSHYKNEAMFSFKREDIEGKPFYKHVYAANNPQIPLGNTPVSVLQHSGALYFATNNPARILKVDEKTMEALHILDYEGERVGCIDAFEYAFSLIIIGDGVCYDYEASQGLFTKFTMRSIQELSPDAYLSDKIVYVIDDYLYSRPYFYDNTTGNIFTIIDYSAHKIEDSRLHGKELLQMVTCGNKKEILMLLKEKATSDIYLAHYIHKTLELRSIKKIPLKQQELISACTASQRDPLFYYAIGNEVYVHNYLAENFSDKPQYTAGNNGDSIAAILFAPSQDKLYIGTNQNNGSDYNGDVFCFDTKNNKLVWSEEGVAGKIVFMGYKKERSW